MEYVPMNFIRWTKQIFFKWIWLLGLIPLLLDYVFTYIPTRYIPARILDLTKEGTTLQLTGILFIIGLFVSVFLVHEDTKKNLNAKIEILEKEIKSLQSEDINEKSIDLSHYSTSAYNAIELKYVLG